jgi:hypothetical protein
MKEPSQEFLRELFYYDPDIGDLIYRKDHFMKKIGERAGNINSEGYRVIRVDGKDFKAHRLIWIYYYGKPPVHSIDHKNAVRDDNRIANLQDIPIEENIREGHRRRKESKIQFLIDSGVTLVKFFRFDKTPQKPA